jgi:hypothetical protein
MSFKSDVDAETERLIGQGIAPMDALKQAVRAISERMSSEINRTEDTVCPFPLPSSPYGKGQES